MLAIKNILVPIDFSERSYNAFEMASALARDHRAGLTLLHVREMVAAPFGEMGMAAPVDLPNREELLDRLAKLEPADESINVEYLVVEGGPAEEIIRAAVDHGCDLIVMATHGRTGLGRLLMGSVAEEVMRKAPCPVMTLKAAVPSLVPEPAPV